MKNIALMGFFLILIGFGESSYSAPVSVIPKSFFITLLMPMLLFLPFLFIAAYFKSPSFKGKMGESIVRRFITKQLDLNIYRVFSDVIILTEDGTTQIDHICVSPFGIFVLETKNFSGWIFGSKNQAQWTQTFHHNKTNFQNPLRQNYKHIKSLELKLGLPLSTFKSVIVFIGASSFKTEMPDEICTRFDFIDYMRSFNTRILSDSQITEICTQVNSIKLKATSQVHREHVRHLLKKY